MDIEKELAGSSFSVFVVRESEYPFKIREILKCLEESGEDVCYVCLSRKYGDIAMDMKEMGVSPEKFYFIDTLSSHYMVPEPSERVTYITAPSNMESLEMAIKKIAGGRKNVSIVFDTISTMLVYQEPFHIMKFAHGLKTEKSLSPARKLMVVVKNGETGEDSIRLIKDLLMIADRAVGMEE